MSLLPVSFEGRVFDFPLSPSTSFSDLLSAAVRQFVSSSSFSVSPSVLWSQYSLTDSDGCSFSHFSDPVLAWLPQLPDGRLILSRRSPVSASSLSQPLAALPESSAMSSPAPALAAPACSSLTAELWRIFSHYSAFSCKTPASTGPASLTEAVHKSGLGDLSLLYWMRMMENAKIIPEKSSSAALVSVPRSPPAGASSPSSSEFPLTRSQAELIFVSEASSNRTKGKNASILSFTHFIRALSRLSSSLYGDSSSLPRLLSSSIFPLCDRWFPDGLSAIIHHPAFQSAVRCYSHVNKLLFQLYSNQSIYTLSDSHSSPLSFRCLLSYDGFLSFAYDFQLNRLISPLELARIVIQSDYDASGPEFPRLPLSLTLSSFESVLYRVAFYNSSRVLDDAVWSVRSFYSFLTKHSILRDKLRKQIVNRREYEKIYRSLDQCVMKQWLSDGKPDYLNQETIKRLVQQGGEVRIKVVRSSGEVTGLDRVDWQSLINGNSAFHSFLDYHLHAADMPESPLKSPTSPSVASVFSPSPVRPSSASSSSLFSPAASEPPQGFFTPPGAEQNTRQRPASAGPALASSMPAPSFSGSASVGRLFTRTRPEFSSPRSASAFARSSDSPDSRLASPLSPSQAPLSPAKFASILPHLIAESEAELAQNLSVKSRIASDRAFRALHSDGFHKTDELYARFKLRDGEKKAEQEQERKAKEKVDQKLKAEALREREEAFKKFQSEAARKAEIDEKKRVEKERKAKIAAEKRAAEAAARRAAQRAHIDRMYHSPHASLGNTRDQIQEKEKEERERLARSKSPKRGIKSPSARLYSPPRSDLSHEERKAAMAATAVAAPPPRKKKAKSKLIVKTQSEHEPEHILPNGAAEEQQFEEYTANAADEYDYDHEQQYAEQEAEPLAETENFETVQSEYVDENDQAQYQEQQYQPEEPDQYADGDSLDAIGSSEAAAIDDELVNGFDETALAEDFSLESPVARKQERTESAEEQEAPAAGSAEVQGELLADEFDELDGSGLLDLSEPDQIDAADWAAVSPVKADQEPDAPAEAPDASAIASAPLSDSDSAASAASGPSPLQVRPIVEHFESLTKAVPAPQSEEKSAAVAIIEKEPNGAEERAKKDESSRADISATVSIAAEASLPESASAPASQGQAPTDSSAAPAAASSSVAVASVRPPLDHSLSLDLDLELDGLQLDSEEEQKKPDNPAESKQEQHHNQTEKKVETPEQSSAQPAAAPVISVTTVDQPVEGAASSSKPLAQSESSATASASTSAAPATEPSPQPQLSVTVSTSQAPKPSPRSGMPFAMPNFRTAPSPAAKQTQPAKAPASSTLTPLEIPSPGEIKREASVVDAETELKQNFGDQKNENKLTKNGNNEANTAPAASTSVQAQVEAPAVAAPSTAAPSLVVPSSSSSSASPSPSSTSGHHKQRPSMKFASLAASLNSSFKPSMLTPGASPSPIAKSTPTDSSPAAEPDSVSPASDLTGDLKFKRPSSIKSAPANESKPAFQMPAFIGSVKSEASQATSDSAQTAPNESSEPAESSASPPTATTASVEPAAEKPKAFAPPLLSVPEPNLANVGSPSPISVSFDSDISLDLGDSEDDAALFADDDRTEREKKANAVVAEALRGLKATLDKKEKESASAPIPTIAQAQNGAESQSQPRASPRLGYTTSPSPSLSAAEPPAELASDKTTSVLEAEPQSASVLPALRAAPPLPPAAAHRRKAPEVPSVPPPQPPSDSAPPPDVEESAICEFVQQSTPFQHFSDGLFGAKPKKKFFRVAALMDKLFYGESESQLDRAVSLIDFQEIRFPSNAKSFAKLKAPESLSALTVVTGGKEFDLLARTPEVAERWAKFFQLCAQWKQKRLAGPTPP